MRKIKVLISRIYFSVKKKLRLKEITGFVKEVYHSFNENNVVKTAASFIYYSLIAAVPFLALFLPILESLGTLPAFYRTVENLFAAIIGAEYAKNLSSLLQGFISNSSSLGIVSLFVFFFSAIMLINRVFISVNEIYKTPQNGTKENLFKRFFTYIVFLIVFIVFAAFFLFSRDKILESLNESLSFVSLSWVSTFLSSGIFKWLMGFAAIFMMIAFIPRVYVKSKYALVGALFAEVGIWGLTLLFQEIVGIAFKNASIIYGSVASIFVFLFWLYFLWIMLLLGVIVAYVSQYHPEISTSEDVTLASKIKRMINLTVEISIAFENAKGGVKLSYLSQKLRLSSYEIISMADKLIDGGIIYAVGKLKNRTYCLAIPPEKISIYYLISIILGNGKEKGRGDKLFKEVHSLLADEYATRTISELIENSQPQ